MRQGLDDLAVTRPGSPGQGGILVLDSWPGLGEALAGVLGRAGLPARACTPANAQEAASTLRPELLLVGFGGPSGALRVLVETVRAAAPDIRVVLLAADEDESARTFATTVGAVGCLTRRQPAEEVVGALRSALAGDRVQLHRQARGRRRTQDRLGLSRREHEILRTMMAGRSNAQIAADLGISAHTVRTHVQNILGKLGARTRLEAVAAAHRLGARPAGGVKVAPGVG